MKTYIIKKTDNIEEANLDFVNVYPWGYSYEPETCFKIAHTDDKFIIMLRSYEKDPVAIVNKKNGPVCNDSCIEFFFSPSPDNSAGYFNFEVNSNPTFLFEYGKAGSENNLPVEWDDSEFNVRSVKSCDGTGRDFWQVNFELPYTMIRSCAGECDLSSGAVIRGNVYKCGCTDQEPHYGSWSPVETPGPNFHIPKFFGKLIIE